MRVENDKAREWYMNEAADQNWLKRYSYSGHSEKRVIGTSFKEVPHGPATKELFKTIQD